MIVISGRPLFAAISTCVPVTLWLRAWLLPTESKDDTGTKAQIVLNIGSRVVESGKEITDIYGTKGKVLGQPDIQATTGFHRERVAACCCACSR